MWIYIYVSVCECILPVHMSMCVCMYVYRELVECDLEFDGMIIMKNSLKPESAPVITVLKNADIRTVMVTGKEALIIKCGTKEKCGCTSLVLNALVHYETYNPF